MNSNLENFCPRLRRGRVIPQGSRIIFETDDPYNQIILPMALADLVLLCSGQFSIRQIVEKIYRKQGAVPFKSILKAIHVLHQGGFFENGQELALNSHLKSWIEPRASRWHLSWRFGQRIIADRSAPMAFYFVTMILLVGSLFGLQETPSHPLAMVNSLFRHGSPEDVVFRIIICSSILHSVRYLLRGIQLLLLTGKAYNVSLRISPWGLYLFVGDEASDLFENRLYTAMFHLSQIVLGWCGLFLLSSVLSPEWWQSLLIVTCIGTYWELNPFVNSEGLRLTQELMLPSDREIASWHYETGSTMAGLNGGDNRQHQDFARICAVWGTCWLLFSFAILLQVAATFGPTLFNNINGFNLPSVISLSGIGFWFTALYSVSQAFVETIILSLVQPWWGRINRRLNELMRNRRVTLDRDEVVKTIQDLPLFSHFHEKHLLRIVDRSEVTDLAAHTHIISPGDPCHQLFVLLSGEVEITHFNGARHWSTSLGPVSIFAETALVDASPQTIQVVTSKKSRILEIPVERIREVALESQTIREVEGFRNAILVNQFFASSPVFRSLSQASIEFLSSRGALEYLDQGQTVFRQGDLGDSLYLMLRGSVDVKVHGIHVTQLNQGAFFGEIALIANIPRTASVFTREPCVFFKISADSFWEILVQNLDLGVFIETISENRLREDLEMASFIKPTGSDSK